MSLLSTGKGFAVGIPREVPKVPEGWRLRTSMFDFPAAISPEDVEWLIDVEGQLHEVKSMANASRFFTGKTMAVAPPYGNGTVELPPQPGGLP